MLLQGMRNLGLNEKEDSLVDELGLSAANQGNSRYSTATKGRVKGNTKTVHESKYGHTTTVSPQGYMPYSGDVNCSEGYSQSDLDLLEAMDYYSTNINTSHSHTRSHTSAASRTQVSAASHSLANSSYHTSRDEVPSARQDSWQNDDFLFNSASE